MITWTPEEIAKRTTDQIKTIKENAARQNRSDIVALCDAELEARRPARPARTASAGEREANAGKYVSEFHFVCPNELGVTRNSDGSVWTGTWVVAEENARNAEAHGAVVALHTSKAEPSYLQGVVKAWRKSLREKRYAEEQLVKTCPASISCLFQTTRRDHGKAMLPRKKAISGASCPMVALVSELPDDGQITSLRQNLFVHPSLKKFFAFPETRFSAMNAASSTQKRGARAIATDVGFGMRWTLWCREASGA
ncbi:MAG: hypothetical protein JO141_27715 [Bradyrhizobium sp.]|nr:hypothetical protein [Bradyrhizobium sp.]